MKSKYAWGLIICCFIFFIQIVLLGTKQDPVFTRILATLGALTCGVIFGSRERREANDDKIGDPNRDRGD